MSKTILATLFVALIVGVIFWFVLIQLHAENTITSVDATPTLVGETVLSTDRQLIERNLSTPGNQVYINQDWRFSFEYPANSNIRLDFGRTPWMLGYFVIESEEDTDWVPVEFFIARDEGYHDEFLIQKKIGDTIIGGQPAWFKDTMTMSVIPLDSYFIEINEEIIMNLAFMKEHKDQYQMILDSFQFHEPLPTLAELEERGVIEKQVQ